jgi:preprotein translocase subunit SecY
MLGVLVMSVGLIVFIVFIERAQRRLIITYPKRQSASQMACPGPDVSFLPLKINTAGVIPPIFAVVAADAADDAGEFLADGRDGLACDVQPVLRPWPSGIHDLLRAADRVLRVLLHGDRLQSDGDGRQPQEARRLHPGIRPGERTAEYIDYVLTRITVVGALYLSAICLLPEILISYAALPFYFGGTSSAHCCERDDGHGRASARASSGTAV